MSVLKFIQAINSCFTMESFMWTFLVSHYNLCNLVLSFSWTFVSQLLIKFEEVFLISTQWMLSSLDNNHLIMKWWLSCKDIILSVLIKSFDIFSLTPFLRCIVLLTTLIRYRRELKNFYMYIYGYTIQTVIQ